MKITVNTKIVFRIFVLLCGLFLVATSVGIGTVWLNRQTRDAERTSILETNTTDSQIYRAGQSAYTNFLQLDRQANMWVGLNPQSNAPLAGQTLAEVLTDRQSLNASIQELQQLPLPGSLKPTVARLSVDTKKYEGYLTQALAVNSSNHSKAQTLLFTSNHPATQAVLSDFNQLNTIAYGNLINDASVSTNRLGDGTKYIVVSDGVLLGLIVLIMILTLLRLAPMEKSLRESERRYRLLFDNISDLVVMFSPQGRVLMASPSHQRLLGFPEMVVEDHSIESIVHPEDVDIVREYMDRAQHDGSVLGTFRLVTAKREAIYVEAGFQRVATNFGQQYIMMVARNVTQERQTAALMEHMAYHDALTGLPNRRKFDEELRQAVYSGSDEPIAVVFIDLNGFKHINDALGHTLGDEVLRTVARLLRRHTPGNSMISRFGGDEFVLLLHGLENKQAVEAVLSGLFREFEHPIKTANREFFVSFSAGISWYPLDSRDPQTLMRQADLAMYQAKDAHNLSWCFFQHDFDTHSQRRFELEEGLRTALQKGEISIVYQPLVQLESQQIFGVEALLRWDHPELGSVSPNEFISVAEETGMIISLGDWVLQRACEQNAEWQRAGYPPIVVAVNVSVRQMMQLDFAEKVKKSLQESGLDGKWLELEVTESVMADKPEEMKLLFEQLKDIGVKIAIDDFGTGYSSLKYLKEFSLDVLKIDKSFVDGIEFSPKTASLVSTIVGLAHGLEFNALAEGVESHSQLKFLISVDCDEAQGYYFGKPMNPEDLWGSVQP